MAYTIMISEGQRAVIAALLKANHRIVKTHQDCAVGIEVENLEPDILEKMFTELAQDEAESPDALHRFCL